ncbi:DEAD/DEAH box helicase [bacterium]|jgi:ATP-dependent RNA helicase DeaD|nr:DEAD/DEAH box helicase [bacterium]MDC0882070.1 DEAD/DEAH box helicase [Candidatus Neomarinimicrobiota bacterium]MBT4248797.1 DEAD/DEAH box helicase [bacterium]MBT4927557.1 DEAD/DEAH box helicase [bacterium]MBT6018149.1 DEAD/DEAH box helicase [bacterium]
METFNDIKLSKQITKSLSELGFVKPTPIQAKTIPLLMDSNNDLIGSAQTGTGKTAAFGIPSIHLTDLSDSRTQTLILCPTRELCMQVTSDIKTYSKYVDNLGVVPIYGGASMEVQIRAIKKRSQIVVGTPGRTKDLLKRKKLFIDRVERVILDEADEMLSMGFKDDLDFILSKISTDNQKLFFSATMPKKLSSIVKQYMNNPVTVAVDPVNTASTNVKHIVHMVQARDRYEVVKRIADINPTIYGIVFCRTRRETKDIASKLVYDGYNADALHGDLSQSQRDDVMRKFRKGQLQLLVATDVASRGLDVNDLSHIINFNLPDDPEVYTHRSGRTGRAGRKGISIAIVHSRETRKVRDIEKLSGVRFEKKLVPTGEDICKKQLFSLIEKIKSVQVDNEKIEPFLDTINEKLEGLSREQLIKQFVSAEFNRFVSYYKNARDININSKDSRDGGGRKNRSNRDRSRNSRDKSRNNKDRSSRVKFSRFHINVGSKNNVNPVKLIGLINDNLKSKNMEIGKIEIMKGFSFFEIDEKFSKSLAGALNGKNFNGTIVKIEGSRPAPANRKDRTRKDSYKKSKSSNRPKNRLKRSMDNRKFRKKKN